MELDYGSWKIVRELGHGSFGRVYEIEQTDELGITTRAALKIIEIPQQVSEVDELRSTGLNNQDITKRFYTIALESANEITMMSKMQGNSNIVNYQAHTVKKHNDGFGWDIYIQMELLTSLTKYNADNSLTREQIIKLGIDMCQALNQCKKNNIIHRDIKPDNIFVSDVGDFKLGDFGIATIQKNCNSERSRKGTFSYMAPEIFWGKGYDLRADIYSLGIVMYQLLNNNLLPFMESALDDKETANYKRMEQGAIIDFPVNEHGELAQIILKACSYNPEDRYVSAKQMQKNLQDLFDKEIRRTGTIQLHSPCPQFIPLPESENSIELHRALPTDDIKPKPKNKKKWIVLLSSIFLFLLIGIGSFVGTNRLLLIDFIDSDETSLRYSVKGGTLTISGNGEMDDYSTINDVPWASQKANIENIVIEAGVLSIGNYAFANCNELYSVSLPDSLISIGDSAFSSCTSLKHISIPKSVISIGEKAFSNCTLITEMELPESLERVGAVSFSGCASLEKVIIPPKVTQIGDAAFLACTSLTDFDVDQNNSAYKAENGVLYSANMKNLIAYPAGKKDSSFVVPNSVDTVSQYAFSYCDYLKKLIFEGDAPTFGTEVFLNSSVTSLSYYREKSGWNDIILENTNLEVVPVEETAIVPEYSDISLFLKNSCVVHVSGGNGIYEWRSEDSGIVSVLPNGEITANAEGITYVICTSGTQQVKIIVRVLGE